MYLIIWSLLIGGSAVLVVRGVGRRQRRKVFLGVLPALLTNPAADPGRGRLPRRTAEDLPLFW